MKKLYLHKNTIAFCLVIYLYAFRGINSFNAPFAPEDSEIFLNQFAEYFNNKISFIEYYFGPTLYLHPKVISKIFSNVSFFLFDDVNFKFLQIVGNFGLLLLFILLLRPFEKINKFLYGFPLALLLFVPIQNTFLTISIVSLPYLLVFVYVSFYHIIRDRIMLSLLFASLATFASGQGFLCLFIIGMYLIANIFSIGKIKKENIVWFISVFLVFTLFYFQIISQNSNFLGNKLAENSVSFSVIDAITYFIVSALLNDLLGLNFDKYQASFIGLNFLFTSIGLIYTVRNKFFEKNAESILLLGYILLMRGLAVIRRMDKNGNFDIIPSRYEIHSIMFFVCLVNVYFQLGVDGWREIIKWIIISVSLILFLFRIEKFTLYTNIKFPRFDVLYNIRNKDISRSYLMDSEIYLLRGTLDIELRSYL